MSQTSATPASNTDQSRSGLIVAAFGRHYEVVPLLHHPSQQSTTPDWLARSVRCTPRGKKSTFACGDQIDFTNSGPDQGVITRLHPRQNLLWRSDAFREKLIASNLTHIVIVVATEPGFSDGLISRCIAAAENEHIQTLIVLNKADLSAGLTKARKRLQLFASLGYPVIEVSARNDISALKVRLESACSILVGQSGMGKSTLTNALIPGADAATREISAALDSGKHTTTHARLYSIGNSGWMIDSPGLQAFGLAHLDPDTLPEQFVEFRPFLGQCRFRDCRHDGEPGCAISTAVEHGAINRLRMQHFIEIRAAIESERKQAQGW